MLISAVMLFMRRGARSVPAPPSAASTKAGPHLDQPQRMQCHKPATHSLCIRTQFRAYFTSGTSICHEVVAGQQIRVGGQGFFLVQTQCFRGFGGGFSREPCIANAPKCNMLGSR
jgi:hypothetical protein